MEYITGKITLREIFYLYWGAYIKWYDGKVREVVIENVIKILQCRTPLLGYHMYKCVQCSRARLIQHSCKSRFCNCCGEIMTYKWTDERLK